MDFSLAFNTKQPHVGIRHLADLSGLDPCLMSWSLDVLTHRSHPGRAREPEGVPVNNCKYLASGA